MKNTFLNTALSKKYPIPTSQNKNLSFSIDKTQKATVTAIAALERDMRNYTTALRRVTAQIRNVKELRRMYITEQKQQYKEDMDAYIHITSPIRRLVDLLNMIKFQQVLQITTLSEKSGVFYQKWVNDLEFINLTMRSIRKVQCDCTLLDLCSNNPAVMDKEYNGYLFDKICRNDGLFQYVVFLPELKLTSRITSRENCENFECKKFTLFLFHNEEKFKKKIRLHIHL
jgi:hypothetical protein